MELWKIIRKWKFWNYLRIGTMKVNWITEVWKVIKISRNKKRTSVYWDRVPKWPCKVGALRGGLGWREAFKWCSWALGILAAPKKKVQRVHRVCKHAFSSNFVFVLPSKWPVVVLLKKSIFLINAIPRLLNDNFRMAKNLGSIESLVCRDWFAPWSVGIAHDQNIVSSSEGILKDRLRV